MSNKPKIYGTCKAGCSWETVHKDDFLASAYKARKEIDENGYAYLEVGETVIARNTDAQTDDSWGFSIKVSNTNFDEELYGNEYSITSAFDKYADGVKIRFLDKRFDFDEYGTSACYVAYLEVNGERLDYKTEHILHQDVNEKIAGLQVRIGPLTECYHINEDSRILAVGEDGYTPQRGVDYWTESDKAEIKAYVDETILGGEW